jgi:hypothetical protein
MYIQSLNSFLNGIASGNIHTTKTTFVGVVVGEGGVPVGKAYLFLSHFDSSSLHLKMIYGVML